MVALAVGDIPPVIPAGNMIFLPDQPP